MADSFNPIVRVLRMHFFWTRPCLQLFDPANWTDFQKKFLKEGAYYQADPSNDSFVLRRLGRRFKFERKVGEKRFQPHKFWSVYMGWVASDNYRGAWNGLAPMRLAFKNLKQDRRLAFDQTFSESLKPQVSAIRAFPNCYLFPIGWSTGVVIQAEGSMPFETIPSLVHRLRTESAFRMGTATRTLKQVLEDFNDSIRRELINQSQPQPPEQSGPYLILGLIEFEGQDDYQKWQSVDSKQASQMLADGLIADENKKVLITPGIQSLIMTALGRGSLVIAGDPKDEPANPSCTLSNLKNALLVTMLMQKFHQYSFRNKSASVARMRAEVMKTFQQLENFWPSSSFRAICNAHAGIRKMRESPKSDDTGGGQEYG